jgi:hypothetical protein
MYARKTKPWTEPCLLSQKGNEVWWEMSELQCGAWGDVSAACIWHCTISQAKPSNCLFSILLEAGVSSPGCFRSRFTGWRYGASPRAKCLRQTHCVLVRKPGTFWMRTFHIKHENSAVPSIRQVADPGSFLICLKAYPDS